MTDIAIEGTVPEWTLGDRLRKAREFAGLHQSDMAEEIEVARRSIGNWEAGVSHPRRPVLIAWALRCGVDYTWLSTGTASAGGSTASNPGTTSANTRTTKRYPAAKPDQTLRNLMHSAPYRTKAS